MLSRNPLRDAPRGVGIAIEQLHDGAVDQRTEREGSVLFAFIALLQRCDKPLEGSNSLRAQKERTHGIESVVAPGTRVDADGFLPSGDVKSALADGDCHDVLPLRQPQRRVAGVRDHFLEHEVATL